MEPATDHAYGIGHAANRQTQACIKAGMSHAPLAAVSFLTSKDPALSALQEAVVELQHRGWKDTAPTVVLHFLRYS